MSLRLLRSASHGADSCRAGRRVSDARHRVLDGPTLVREESRGGCHSGTRGCRSCECSVTSAWTARMRRWKATGSRNEPCVRCRGLDAVRVRRDGGVWRSAGRAVSPAGSGASGADRQPRPGSHHLRRCDHRARQHHHRMRPAHRRVRRPAEDDVSAHPAVGRSRALRAALSARDEPAGVSVGRDRAFVVRARVPVTIEMPLDRADRCGTPTDIATMALVVDGTIEVASRQTWTLRYLFAP